MLSYPKVTFAVLGFNQEKYIAEAIRGAFSQEFPPMQIILSDDASTDSTYEIMQKMAADYSGPHQVVTRKSCENGGTLAHLLNIARQSAGEYLIVAGGDDVSLPSRTKLSIEKLLRKPRVAFSSDDIHIDEFGNRPAIPEKRSRLRDRWWLENPSWLHGATATYEVDILRTLPVPEDRVLYEDVALIHFFSIVGEKTLRSKEKTVYYRRHSGNISTRVGSAKTVGLNENLLVERWRHAFKAINYAIDAAEGATRSKIKPDYSADDRSRRDSEEMLKNLKYQREMLRLLSRWPTITGRDRLKLCYLGFKANSLRTCLIRCFGWRIFAMIQGVRSKSPS